MKFENKKNLSKFEKVRLKVNRHLLELAVESKANAEKDIKAYRSIIAKIINR